MRDGGCHLHTARASSGAKVVSAGYKLTVAAARITYLVLQEPYVNVYQNSNISATVWGEGHEIKRKMGSSSEKQNKS